MISIQLTRYLQATPSEVWAELKQLDRHVLWMDDAEAITFRNEQHSGIGTELDCATKLGPLRTNDVITVIDWVDEQRMSVEHRGIVTGRGTFELHDDPQGTRLVWSERLRLPWIPFAGPIGEVFAKPLMLLTWKRDLDNFVALVEAR